jgi:hypothetical protein
MRKENCWEAMKCGREPGGVNADALGACPVPTETELDGINGGVNGGRVCWAVRRRNGFRMEARGEFTHCDQCIFFRRVEEEEGSSFTVMGAMRPVPWTRLRVARRTRLCSSVEGGATPPEGPVGLEDSDG